MFSRVLRISDTEGLHISHKYGLVILVVNAEIPTLLFFRKGYEIKTKWVLPNALCSQSEVSEQPYPYSEIPLEHYV